MPSPKTTYLNLPLYDANDTSTNFLDYWHSINLNADGVQYDRSAFQLLDAAYHDLDVRINNIPSQIADLLDAAMGDTY